jgi:hypothetical protein
MYTVPHFSDIKRSLNHNTDFIAERRRWVGHVACMGEMINAYKILVGKPDWK